MVRKAYNYRMLRLFLGAMAMLIVLVALSASVAAMAWGPLAQKSFGSPQHAVDALVVAVQDDNDAELLAILGPGSEDLISSGDPVADQNGRSRFLKAYEEKNSLEKESEGHEVLLVGSKDYPFPIPIVRQKDAWVFDTQAGMEEILNRRIGKNELHTIEVMHAYTDAQREYACTVRDDGGGPEFAQQFTSSEGKKDGLYWEAEESEMESPFGPLIARATEEGYGVGLDKEPPRTLSWLLFQNSQGTGRSCQRWHL